MREDKRPRRRLRHAHLLMTCRSSGVRAGLGARVSAEGEGLREGSSIDACWLPLLDAREP